MDTTRQFASQIRVGFQEQARSNVCSDSEVHSFKLTLRETIRAKERKFTVGIIVSDDDSTMRAVLKHSYKALE